MLRRISLAPRSAIVVGILAAGFLLLAACAMIAPAAAPAAADVEDEAVAGEAAAPAAEAPIEAFEAPAEAAVVEAAPAPVEALETAAVFDLGAATAGAPAPGGERKIIKNGDLRLQVADTDTAIDRITQIAADAGGYILSSKSWYQESGTPIVNEDGGEGGVANHKYATVALAVPADQFEWTLGRLRGIAVRVLNETASGEDVTKEFVDLESQLDNLKATRDRIRGFLDRAETVEEALKVNEQLAEVEGEIAETQGRMNYLAGRAAYSTISVNVEPDIPQPTPTPTPSPTPTPTPEGWNPGATFSEAGGTLQGAYQGIVDALIWLFVVVVPIVAPIALVVWAVWYFGWRRRRKGPA